MSRDAVAAASPAQAYQEYFGPAIFEPLAAKVLAVAPPAAGHRILDVACGTGILTRRLAEAAGPGGQVVGIDINPAMIDVARAQAATGAPVEYRHGDGIALDAPAATFDAVYCQQGLQFFPDRPAGAREMRRVLGDGGRAVVATWRGLDHHPLYAALADAEEPHLADLGVRIGRDELEAPFSLGDPDELTGLLHGAGFAHVRVHAVSLEACFADADHFVERMEYAYAAVIPRFTEDPASFAAYLQAIGRATAQVVADHRDGDTVVVPMHANIAIAA
ncbi:class I SAM-dependent methyltransferase [Blastococcus deserti]|uniref:Class I SAM-dependent methyltransferase n=1 Tax=Blastococcus deserti TaxID=2259033 RepID=A0ABW4XEN5_9ACTN